MLLASVAFAGPMSCVMAPMFPPDSVPVCANAPGLGSSYIVPEGPYAVNVYFEDLNAVTSGVNVQGLPGDGDYNDAVATLRFDGQTTTLEWSGFNGAAAYINLVQMWFGPPSVSIASPGPHTIPNLQPGWEAMFQMHIQSPSLPAGQNVFTSGPGSRNIDLLPHAIVEPIPEPATMALFGGGLALLGLARFRKSRK